MNDLSIKELIFRFRNNSQNVDVLKNNMNGNINLVFDDEDESTQAYFQRVKQLIEKKTYSVTLNRESQIDFLIDLIGDNKRIQQLKITSGILNTLIVTKLYLIILPHVQQLYITDTLQKITNDFPIEKFSLKTLVLDSYETNFKEDYSTMVEIMKNSDRIIIKQMNVKGVTGLGKDVLDKFTEETTLFFNQRNNLENKQIIQSLALFNSCKNMKKISLSYTFCDKFQNLHQHLSQFEKEFCLNLYLDVSTNFKQLSSLLKNKPNIKEVNFTVAQKLNNDEYKKHKLFEGSSVTRVSIQSANSSFLDYILKDVQVIRHQLTHLNVKLENSTQVKYLNSILQDNKTLKCLQINFNYPHEKLKRIVQETIPMMRAIPTLDELTIQFRYSLQQDPNVNEVYALLPTLNVKQLNILQLNYLDFIQDNVLTVFRNSTKLATLYLSFGGQINRLNYSQVKTLHSEIQMKNDSNLKLIVGNYMNPLFDCYLHSLMNTNIDNQILNKIAFTNIIAPLMSFSPEQIYQDLNYD